MFERPQSGETAVLVHIDFAELADNRELDEFAELARSAGAQVQEIVRLRRRAPDSKYFVGSGKAEEIAAAVVASGAQLVIFNHGLSPSQERNLEALFKTRVLDRTGLILDIFAQRARSHEGKLQVELAQLNHLATRLVRGWTHLERQKGGIGLRGPGETQLETDRRLLGGRIKQINRKLERVRSQREQGRQARRKAELPTIALVGYTNAGKSTLFNRLCDARVRAANQLFATLDPTLRRIELAPGTVAVMADTVGFVRDLPHELVEAFHATLQETRDADLLLHVVDAADPERLQTMSQVESVLRDIGAGEQTVIQVYNKLDLLDDTPHVDRNPEGDVERVWVSAHDGRGIDLLRQVLAQYFVPDMVHGWMHLEPGEGRLRARLFGLGAVLDERIDDYGAWELEVRLPQRELDVALASTRRAEAGLRPA
ncbi:ribosome rescue GTPase HflX [Acidihalobacter ferrooxydans]|uniref:GTPase HflX n=1 Tax=Acidihalobacter ferrooxydans TaxID=1765967 RepID=A0A1P8UI75_9GAMM|nr:ribosome rescue GTPase HflX [Acidihalobacter ferrooxydans]APZ43545.1 GTPase HflX [Acidihalobacter ferrooxydans]